MTLVSRRVRVDGADLNVMIAGAGPDVLLVHGFPDDHTVWRLQIPALVEAGYRVIAVDTRGCGASTVPAREADYRIERLVDDLVAVLDALEVRKVRVVGHDWGALQSWMLAARHPERVVSLIALAVGHPGAYARGGLMQKLRGYYVLLLQLRGLIEHCLRVRNWRALGVIAGYDPELAHWKTLLGRPGRLTAGCNYYRANLRLFVSPFDERIGVPTVGVWSSGDRFLTERQMQYSASYCDAGWQYVRLDGPNHWPQLSAPARLNALLLQHLAA
jgi:pimeloyl-ACP methyl ester carboxylesterase